MMSVLQLRTLSLLLLLEGVSAQSCDTFTCTSANTVKVGNAVSVLCADNPNGGTCRDEYCCTASCSSITCATGYTNWGAGLQCRPADFGGCTQDTCCRSNAAAGGTTAGTTDGTTGGTTGDTAGGTTGDTTGGTADTTGGTTGDTAAGTTDTNVQQVNIVVQVITLTETATTATATTAVTTTPEATTATTAAPTVATTTAMSGSAVLPSGGGTAVLPADLPAGGGTAVLPAGGVDSMPGNTAQAMAYGESLEGLWSAAGLPRRGLVAWAGMVAGILGAAALVTTLVLGRYRGLAMGAEFEVLEASTQFLEEQ